MVAISSSELLLSISMGLSRWSDWDGSGLRISQLAHCGIVDVMSPLGGGTRNRGPSHSRASIPLLPEVMFPFSTTDVTSITENYGPQTIGVKVVVLFCALYSSGVSTVSQLYIHCASVCPLLMPMDQI